MIKTVYLDMDGVLVDFVGGLHQALHVPYLINRYPYEKGKWDMLTDIKRGYYGELSTTFERCNNCCTHDFWANLKWMHDGHDILRAVTYKFAPVQIYLLTAPMPNIESASGKMKWVEKHLPEYLKRTIITTTSKSLLAKPDALLIDDRDKNIDEFVAAGGQGLLVPRPWNHAHICADRTVQVVEDFLKELT